MSTERPEERAIRKAEERYIDALVGANRRLSFQTQLSDSSTTPPDKKGLIDWGRAINQAAVVASSPVYDELIIASGQVNSVESQAVQQRSNLSIHENLLASAYEGVRRNGATASLSHNIPIGNLIKYTLVPEGWEGVPKDQIAKTAFIEAIMAYTFKDNLAHRTKKHGEGTTALAQTHDFRRSMSGVRNNILGWVRKGDQAKLHKKYNLDIDGVDKEKLADYANKLLSNPKAAGSTVFCINQETLAEIDEKIANSDGDEKQELQRVKKILGGLAQAVYLEIDKRIDDTRLGEIEQVMRDQVNYIGGDKSKPRQNTIIMINGHTGAGKGTTLGMLGARAVETGTDGIAGRGDGYSQYEKVMGPYDLARANGQLIPTRVMKLLFAAEMLHQRQQLDEADKVNEPVYVSGYPRTTSQAETFKGVNNIKSVALTISPKTAVTRTLTRIAFAIDKMKNPRADDFNDLEVPSADNKEEVLKALVEAQVLICKNREGNLIDVLSRDLAENVSPLCQMSSKSRYWRYDKVINDISTLLASENYGVQTTMIVGDGKTPEQVTEEVGKAIS